MTEIKRLDDYNYPPMNRGDLMKNKPLNSSDFRIRKFKQIDTNRNYSFNNYALDIEGACPKRCGFYSLKPDYTNTNDDIEYSKPKALYQYLTKPDYSLSNRDIEHSSPMKMSTFNTSRHVNPLSPDYPLPSANPICFPSTIPKFLRDNINVNDIQGAHPRQRHNKYIRDNMLAYSCDAKTRKKIDKREVYDNIDYSDISKKNGLSNRCVNPLDPVYNVRYNDEENYIHGEIEGSKPSSFSKFNIVSTNLTTEDIEGAQANTLNYYKQWKDKHNGKHFAYSLPEIEKSQSNTLKKGMTTSRCINPLEPDYQLLDRNSSSNNTIINSKIEKKRYQNNFDNNQLYNYTETKEEDDKRVLSENNAQINNKNYQMQNVLSSNRLIESYAQTDSNLDIHNIINSKIKKNRLNDFISSLNTEKIPKIR